MIRYLLLLSLAVCCFAQAPYSGWPIVGGSSENLHYSSLKQINTKNVTSLKIAWTFDSHDATEGSDIQCNPVIIDGVIYVTTAKVRVVALDAATGKQIWAFDGVKGPRAPNESRGVTYWSGSGESRILVTLGHDLYSLDTKTGRPDPQFGENGKIDMRKAYDQPLEDVSMSATSPGVIYRDLYIIGSTVAETLPAPVGDIRAYNVRTGALAWTFHTIPHPGEFGYDTWPPNAYKHSGAANAWAGLAVDVKRGLVFAPTGSAAFDFYGADRHGDDLFSDTLLCLDAATGKRKWHFQPIHHDVWDLDFPQPPVLLQVRRNGKLIDAVAQAGKSGYIFVLDRETGKSLFPLTERSVPASNVDGELLAKTQVVPSRPAPFVRQEFNEDTVTNRTPAAHQAVLEELQHMDHGSIFTPPSLRGTVNFPGLAGGAEWGGAAYDPDTHLYYVNANELGWVVKLIEPRVTERTTTAGALYKARCAMCHGPERKGAPPEYPELDHLADKLTDAQVTNIIHNGTGRMPSFARLGDPAIAALKDFLLKNEDNPVTLQFKPRVSLGLKYTVQGYQKFLDPDGYPASTPPWGTLSAINLDTGDYAWKVPLGEYPELVAKGMKDTGSENHGGGAVTAGGLFFIGATHYDNKFRAFDKLTGKLLWEKVLPFAANATPSVYEVNGKEYVVVAAGGGRERPSGGLFVAFALP